MDMAARHERVGDYLHHIGLLLGDKTRLAPFAAYFVGLLSSLPRKNTEAIATLFADESNITATYKKLNNFLCASPWRDAAVRDFSTRYALDLLPENDPVEYWIIDDTGFIKKGKHSVGVQRQYTGTSGKVDNCQTAVSISAATEQRQIPLDMQLYLGKSWTDNAERRAEARIPEGIGFRTKPEIAEDMLRGVCASTSARAMVLADHAYGNAASFRRTLVELGLDYSVDIGPNTKMWRLDANERRRGPVTSAKALGGRLEYRRYTWREGTQRDLASRFAFARVVVEGDLKQDGQLRPVWLVAERPFDDTESPGYFVSTLPPNTPHIAIVRAHMNRWRTERMYQDLKGVCGLDHYEGRRYPGWNHHVTVAMAAYAFSFAEQARLFPPPPNRPKVRGAVRVSTGTPLRRFDDFHGTAVIWGTARMVAAMSGVPPGPLS